MLDFNFSCVFAEGAVAGEGLRRLYPLPRGLTKRGSLIWLINWRGFGVLPPKKTQKIKKKNPTEFFLAFLRAVFPPGSPSLANPARNEGGSKPEKLLISAN